MTSTSAGAASMNALTVAESSVVFCRNFGEKKP